MKLSAVLIAATFADDKKVPPRHPVQRLTKLVNFSSELLDTWFTSLPSQQSWKQKFETNGLRMRNTFFRCGFYDNQLPNGGPAPAEEVAVEARKRRADDDDLRYDRQDPCKGTKQITTGFRKWAQRYLSQCSGQRKFSHQINRMNKWYTKLAGHLECCPEGWEKHELSDGWKCLQINRGQFHWNTALSTCQNQNSRLAQPKNDRENKLFCDLVGYNVHDMWYAGNDIDRDGEFSSFGTCSKSLRYLARCE